jgi:putative CRISPR-associated protein (TIGR02619 family)
MQEGLGSFSVQFSQVCEKKREGGELTHRTIILPVGLSLLRGLKDKNINLTPGHESAQLPDVIRSLGDATVDGLSAELFSLKKLEATKEDQAIFLATDTDSSEHAAKINALIAERHYEIATAVDRVKSLVLDNAETFKKQGLRSLFQRLDYFVDKAVEQGREPQLNISGGIKPVIPYIAIYGLLRRISLTYTFETTQTLVVLPPLPIDFDWAGLQAARQALQQINQETAIEQRQLKAYLRDDFTRLEGLFEDMGKGRVTLSTFGFMLLKEIEGAREKPVMLSPSALREFEATQGDDRQRLEILLDRVRNPLWRAQKHHIFQGTNLSVYKPGSTSRRLAGWVENGMVYVAELYTEHDEYERALPNRRRDQYRPRDFQPYLPNPDPLLSAEEQSLLADDLLTKATQEKKKAETERDEAYRLSAQYQDKCNEARREAEALRRQRGELRSQGDDLRRRLAELRREAEAVKRQLTEVQKEAGDPRKPLSELQREAEDVRRQLAEIQKEAGDLRRQKTELEKERQERSSWGVWRRLRWALFGS